MCSVVCSKSLFHIVSYLFSTKEKTAQNVDVTTFISDFFFSNWTYFDVITSQEGFEPPTDALAYHYSFRYQCKLFVVWTISSPLQVRHV